MQISPELWKAYEAATVEVHLSGKNFVFPPVSSQIAPQIPEALIPEGIVITAWNPGSRRRSDAENRKFHARLKAAVESRGWVSFPAIGHDGLGTWREEGLAVVDPPLAEALELAAHFSQNAVYWWGGEIWRVLAVPRCL